MNRVAAPVIALFFLSAGAWTQTREGEKPQGTPVVTAVAVFGNKTTAREIILRELTIGVGDTVDEAEIAYSQERIYSLGLFNRVHIAYPPLDSTTLIVDVEERWYVYPVPLIGTVERDIHRWYYGIGVKHDNFRGWNEKVFAGFVLGGNPWAGFSYSNPWVLSHGELYLETSAWYRRIENKSALARGDGPNFHETHYTWDATIGKRLGLFHKLWLGAGFQYVEVSDKRPGRTIAPGGIDRSLWVGAGFQRDTRNLAEYPTNGMYGSVSLARQGVGFGDVDMFVAAADLRVYRPVAAGACLAARCFTRLTGGPAVPPYAHGFFGFSERIRGHFFEEREGENMACASVELRVPVVPSFYLTVPQVPYREFAVWRLALYAAAFADAGTTWDRRENPFSKDMPGGYGFGLHAVLPYSVVFRAERAWNGAGRGEWIFDMGVSF